MNVSGFVASADIIGRRVRISWDFVPQDPETLADVPPVTLRRKLRDFAFPSATRPDPYLVYDSTSFPPAPIPGALSVTDLPSWQKNWNGSLTVFEPVSVAVFAGGRMVEVLRRTIGTTYNSSGIPVQQRVEILDTGQYPGNLQANTTYYYQVFSLNLPASGDTAQPYRSSAMVTDTYGLNRTLYDSLPEIYRRHDVQTRPITPGVDSVPEQAPRFGQLRRFVDLFGVALDSIRGGAEGLWTLHDIDRVDARYLPLLAQWIGWELSVDSEIPVQRNEIKTAARLYKLVGTPPGLRALVTQYTGWFAQVTEFAQNLTLSNQPPQRNLFGITLAAGGASWHGINDSADALGFGAGNQNAGGSSLTAAALTGTVAEPFALRAGMTLTAAVDGLLPAAVRFGSGDFADPTHATAAEVATAIRRGLPELNATAVGGRVVLASETVGEQSQIRIAPDSTSLVSLQNSPSGRLSPVTDSLSRLRLFYEAWETPSQPEAAAPTTGVDAPSTAGAYVLRRLHYKTLMNGVWLDSHPIFPQNVIAQSDPAGIALPDDRLWVAWVDNPQTSGSHLRFTIGLSRPLLPARLLGLRRQPFALTDGAVLTLTGAWAGADKFTVHAASFANVAQATVTEIVAAMNAQLTQTVATAQTDGSLRIETLSGGPQASLEVDLRHSTTARALGFDNRNNVGTPGSWSEEIDWSTPLNVVSIAPGRHAELTALNDPSGGVRLAWSYYLAGRWRIESVHWAEQIIAATANGLFLRAGAGPWTAIAGLPSTNVRSVAVDSSGTTWIATGSGVVLRSPAGAISALAAALPSTDVRSVKLARDGSAWFATAAGVAILALTGALTTLTAAGGLPSNDVRAISLTDNGSAWIATASGLTVRSASGNLKVFDSSHGLPSSDVRDSAVGADGTVYAATGAGLVAIAPGGVITTVDATSGLPSSDVRAVAVDGDGTLLAATAGGVSQRIANVWTTFDTASGLPSNDTRTVSFAADGSIWVGTASGVSVIAPDESITTLDIVGGGVVNPAAQSVHTGWSSPFELSADSSNREPALALDETNRTWLLWSKQVAAGDPNDSWALHYRIFDPAAGSWGADTTLTAPPVGGRSSDRTPGVLRIPGGMRIFFSSDRNGGFGLWSVDITLAGVIGPLVSITEDSSSDLAPAPANVGGAVWLLYRSDRNIALTQVGVMDPGKSERVPDNGALRRYAGSVSASPENLTRNRMRGLFGDLLNYTPNRPDGGATLTDSEVYTRGTVGIYVSRTNQGSVLTQQEASRLRALLTSLIPVNMRAVISVVAPPDTEFVYSADADIGESYNDVYPFAETLGAIQETTAAAMPGVAVIHSNVAGNISVNPANLATLRLRTFFPPIE